MSGKHGALFHLNYLLDVEERWRQAGGEISGEEVREKSSHLHIDDV